MAVVNLKELQVGAEVPIPDFNGEGEITVRLKRPSILSMAAKGMIPNGLMAAAQKVFTEDTSNGDVDVSQIGGVMDIVAEAALVDPTYAEIKEAGFELTDDQVSHIFTFVQGGVNGLKKFRTEQSSNEDNQPIRDLQSPAFRDSWL